MRIVLLTRNSEFQIFCANLLWRRGLLNLVISEENYSFTRGDRRGFKPYALFKNIKIIFPNILKRPLSLIEYMRLYFSKNKYFGSQEQHDKRLLKYDYKALADGLPSIVVSDINSHQVRDALQNFSPDIVLVFGTRLIKSVLFDSHPAKYVNMHWGWSPDYRGEGIVSALATQGINALGVTVHLISSKIDGGDILYRIRPSIDANDNFYSIGLKLTLLGVELFIKSIDKYRKYGELVGEPQDLKKGRLYDSKYMRHHPELYQKAWKNLIKSSSKDM